MEKSKAKPMNRTRIDIQETEKKDKIYNYRKFLVILIGTAIHEKKLGKENG